MRLLALVVVVVVLAVVAAPCQAAGFRIEAESFIDANDLGGTQIVVVGCTYASGGVAVGGLDGPGEWIEFRLELSSTTTFVDSLRSAGLVGEVRHFSVLFLSGGDPVGAPGDTVTSGPGLGFS